MAAQLGKLLKSWTLSNGAVVFNSYCATDERNPDGSPKYVPCCSRVEQLPAARVVAEGGNDTRQNREVSLSDIVQGVAVGLMLKPEIRAHLGIREKPGD